MEKFRILDTTGVTSIDTHYFLTEQRKGGIVRMSTGIERYEELESKTANFLKTLDDIRNYIATHEEGITRDQTIAEQMINILICKMSSESDGEDIFYNSEGSEQVPNQIQNYYEESVKEKYTDTLPNGGELELSDDTLRYVADHLANTKLSDLGNEVLGEAFQFFITPVLKGSQGQFFTPENAVEMMVDMVNPQPNEKVIDPACGTGGFLTAASAHSGEGDTFATGSGQGQAALTSYQSRGETEAGYYGIDKDDFLTKISRARAILSGNRPDQIFCENSLHPPDKWNRDTQEDIEFGTYDVVLANPPFGADQKVKDDEVLEQFDLGYKWKSDSEGNWVKTSRTVNTAVQVLFIERSLQLLRPGGRMGIVLPESLFGNPSYRYVMQFLEQKTKIHAVVAMPEELFQPYTHAKTCVLIAEKDESESNEHGIFMASAEWCGHDSRGNPTTKTDQNGDARLLDDLPLIQKRYDQMVLAGNEVEESSLGFFVDSVDIENSIYVPRYHDPEVADSFASLSETHKLVKLGDLLDEGIISIDTGVEVGKMAYGTGDIPFIRTSDIANWETKIDPQHSVSEEIYDEYKEKTDVQPQDILLVKDGTSLIGTSCMISKYDTKMLFQSHIYRIRVNDEAKLSPYELFGALNHPVVNEQIKARQFTQQIIDSLSKERLREVVLPIPDEEGTEEQYINQVREIIETRARLKNEARKLMRRED